jgi:hypothetical protein
VSIHNWYLSDFKLDAARSQPKAVPYIVDMAYQCRFSRNTGQSILQSLGFSQDITSHSLYMSFIYHFK